MVDAALGRRRLVAQGLVTRPFATPAAAVAAFGAMQGQDLPGAMASAALRSTGKAADVVADMDAGRLVRAYPMRGTVFLMHADDALWASQLCNAPALRAQEKRRGQLGLDDAQVGRARDVALVALAEAPRGLPRTELMALWEQAGMATTGGRGYHVLSWLIGRGDVVFGPWNGADQDVAAASSWLPAGSSLEGRFNGDRIAAAAEFLRRYLTTHGPATLRDFAWWTKLPLKEVRAAWAVVADEFVVDGELIGRPGLDGDVAASGKSAGGAFLLPGFDEFILGYQDRLFAMSPQEHALLVPGNNGVFGRSIVVDGLARGLWKRGGRPGRRTFEPTVFSSEGQKPLTGTTWRRLETLFAVFPFATP